MGFVCVLYCGHDDLLGKMAMGFPSARVLIYAIFFNGAGWMRSTKKRFKLLLAVVERQAADLRGFAQGIALLEDVESLANRALCACESLKLRVAELPKQAFVQQILQEDALLRLDELVDQDVVSELERRFAGSLRGVDSRELGDLLRQLLDKVEQHVARMSESIQQLVALLNAE